jgi:UMF1 family MFS transporter
MSEPTVPVRRAEIFGWAMFDFANSSYTTVIVTVVYATVFPRLIVGDGPDFRLGNLWWSAALSISYGLAAVSVPVLGALMDASGAKKAFLTASWLATVVTTAALWFATPGHVLLAVALIVASNWAYSVGESFAASFLPDLGPPESLGRISGVAWGLGYFGGLVSTSLVLLLGEQTLENFARLRFIGPVTAGFFFLAALPTFALLRDRGPRRPLSLASAGEALGRLAQTARTLAHYRDLLVFFGGLLFAMAGLSIVVSFAFIYGDQVIRWSPGTRTAMFVITQFTAAIGAAAFGWLQGRMGDKRTYLLTLAVWVLAVGLIWGTPTLSRWLTAVGVPVGAEQVFLGVGCVAGVCLGATQSAGRTMVALFSPPDKVGEFFGLWGLFGKVAAIFGLMSLGVLQTWLGLQLSILVCGLFFAAAFAITWFVDEERGKAVAAGPAPAAVGASVAAP